MSTSIALVRESGLSWEPFDQDTSGVDEGALVAAARRHKSPLHLLLRCLSHPFRSLTYRLNGHPGVVH